MEEPTHSSESKALCSPSSEGSGWTIYFEDFLASEKREETASSSDHCSSIVSNATSYVAPKRKKKLSFKKRKARGVFTDDPLEDTATSPYNSPKVSGLSHLDVNSMIKDGKRGISQEKGIGYGKCMELRDGRDDDDGFVERVNECSELRKRGLCLVPLSMLVDYLG